MRKEKQSILKKGMDRILKVSLLIILLVIATPLPSLGQVKRSEIRIGVSISLSGPFGGLGQEARDGMAYAVEGINKVGGISVAEGANLPLRLIVYDDKSDQTISVGNMERLITVDKVDFLLGHIASPIIMADAGVAEKYGVPYLTAGIPTPEVHKGEIFKWTWVVFHRSDLQYSAVREMLNTIAPGMTKKVALWRENTILGELLEKTEVPAFKAASWEVFVLPYTAGSKDFTDLIIKTKQSGTSMILGVPTPVDAIVSIRQMKELGYAPQIIVWPRGASVIQFRDALGPDADYVADSVGWSPNVNYPGNRELSEHYRKDTGRTAAAVLGPSFACAQVLFDAIKRAGALEKTKVREAIQKTDLMTVNGRLTFPAKGSPIVKIIMNQWQKGKYVSVWSPELADAKPIFPMPPWERR
jgi:branched-chain amino acid transport system substrate-binding protein